MTDPVHPDSKLERVLAPHMANPSRVAQLRMVHDVCQQLHDNGHRNFQLAALAREMAARKLLSVSTMMNGAKHNGFGALAKVWQAFVNDPDPELDPMWPMSHPEVVFQRLLAVPGRREHMAAKLREVHQLCRARFARGEQDFRPSIVAGAAAERGIKESVILSGASKKDYAELLDGWQALALQRGPVDEEGVPPNHPDAVLRRLLRSPNEKTSQHRYYRGLHEVCQAKVEAGEYDLSRSAIAAAAVKAGVFTSANTLVTKFATNDSYREILEAWQELANSRWIDTDPKLPPTNPHAVYRRLAAKRGRADALQRLLGVHRVCFLHHASGSRDFTTKTIGQLCEEQGVLAAHTIHATSSDDYRTLASAWSDHARPWLAETEPPKELPKRLQRAHDVHLEWVRRDYPEFEEWRLIAVEWLEGTSSGLSQRLSMLSAFFEDYLTRLDVPKLPAELLRRGTRLPDFIDVAARSSDNKRKVQINNQLSELLDYALLRDCSDEEDGERIISPAFRNPFPRAGGARGITLGESNKPALPYGYIHELRRILAQGPTFRDWTFAHDAQGAELGKHGAPGKAWFTVPLSLIDKDDPDCVWRKRVVPRKGKPKVFYQIWSPVRWVALLVKLLLPLRTAQVRWLDSGESDTWKYVAGAWVPNDHPLAALDQRAPWSQGVHRRVVDSVDAKVTTELYISTNKTADREKSGPEKGYQIPWFVSPDPIEDVYYWLEKLRDWQSKYNPIGRRTSWMELDARHIGPKTKAQRASYADTCFLFRAAEKPDPKDRALPIADGEVSYAWMGLLREFQNRLSKRGEVDAGGEPIVLVKFDDMGRGTTDFVLHGLRVSLITALALDGELPFPILQKLVGHARLLMTLYYFRPGETNKRLVLSEVGARLDAKKEASIHRFYKDTAHDRLVDTAICNSKATLAAVIPIHPAERNPAGWMPMHHGMCLVGGNTSELEDNRKIGGCHNGGPDTGTPGKPNYSAVPGGARNCIRCRWFVTEPHYLPALAAHFHTLAYHFDEARNASMDSEKKLQTLKREKAGIEADGNVFDQMTELRQAERIWEANMKRFSDRCEDLVACWRLVERCKNALNEGPAEGLQLMVQGDISHIEAVFEETESELLQLVGVCENVQLYPDLDPGKAIVRRSQHLDTALYNEGLPPMFLRLTEAEQLSVGNAFVQRLAKVANPESMYLGQRKIVEIIDAGAKLGESLGIDLVASLPELLDPRPSTKALSRGRDLELIEA
ncbi:gamma-mobile-trio protein GmtX [Roseateles sp. DC23W]|uniref:Gamma-mobile-trio protein GmtX n=1 Tax=Pelomonas dachongensis TaxID=3299029 RepID=A0ABW7EG82_9BURK